MTTATPVVMPTATKRSRLPHIALGVVGLLIAVTAVWGGALDRVGRGIVLHAAPLFAAWHPRTGIALLGPLGIAALVIRRGPEVAERLGWHRLLVAAAIVTSAWAVALALVDPEGLIGLTRGVSSPQDFLADVDRIGAPGPFVDHFTERIDEYVVHVRGHPPGLIVALWWMQRIGLGGPAPFVALIVTASTATVVCVLVALRSVADESTARKAAPFLALSPAAIWFVSSADAIYAGLGAAGVAAMILATSRRVVWSDGLAAIGGLTFGLGLYVSYGLVLLLLVPAVVAFRRRHIRSLVIAGVAMVAVGTMFAAFGFSWLDGLGATRAEYAASVASIRPYDYFVLANVAAFAIAVGPAPIAGIASTRDRRLWLLVGSALVAVLAADLSGLSKGEVERIWLPFLPWVAIAAGALVSHRRWWLGVQAALAITVQSLLGTPW